jgi:hypothetical protein
MRRRPMQAWPKGYQASTKSGSASRLGLLFALACVAALTSATSAAAAPTVSYSCTPTPTSCVGWYRSNVRIQWTYNDPDGVMNTDGCNTHTVTTDTTGSPEHCYVQDLNGIWTRIDLSLRRDATPPQITAVAPSRAPDFDGWYTHPVGLTWSGTDATSGLASCSSATYAGPDSSAAQATGTCRDKAGNVASTSFSLKYDATPPTLTNVGVVSRASSDLLRWTSTGRTDTAVVQRWARGSSQRAVIFRGSDVRFVDKKIHVGLEYIYAVQTIDQAGNVSKRITVKGLPKVLTLHPMRYVPRAAPHPVLRWPKVRGADYYHVQLFRGSKRILAAWPSTRQLALPHSWKWARHRYTLRPGRYRWFAWAGLGRRAFARYHSIGRARFIVPRR